MKPDEFYEGLEEDAHLDDPQMGPMECDICEELFEVDFTSMCPWCGQTVCEYCWEKHYNSCEGGIDEKSTKRHDTM